MFERFRKGDFEVATAVEAPEPCLWSIAAGEAENEAGKTDGIVRPDDRILRRISCEILRDLGLKEATIAAYFARYDKPLRRAEPPA